MEELKKEWGARLTMRGRKLQLVNIKAQLSAFQGEGVMTDDKTVVTWAYFSAPNIFRR